MARAVLVFLIGCSFLEAGATGVLPAPCRSWSSCNQLRCTSEGQYQSSLRHLTPCTGSGSTTPPSPSGECAVVNGTCVFTDSAPNCTSWLSLCERQYHCTTEEERMNKTSEESNCSLGNQVPAPDSLCEPMNGSCQWYNPCRTWRGHCWAGYQCGSESDYWNFVNGPQSLCYLPPPSWQVPVPPGKCIVQDGKCDWSYCKPWLDWCKTFWLCGTNYEYRKYFSGYPPPCPHLPDNYHPPPQPGPCQFNISSLSCDFNTSCILDSGRPITFKCLGHIHNPNHLYLDGLTVSGGVNLAPSTHYPYTGARWLPVKLADGSYAFKCLGHINNPNHLYLNGLTVTGDVILAPNTHGQYTGTHWRAYMLPDGSYSFKCLGHIYNPNNLYLDGLTVTGDVNLAPSVSGGFTGTHWRIEYA